MTDLVAGTVTSKNGKLTAGMTRDDLAKQEGSEQIVKQLIIDSTRV